MIGLKAFSAAVFGGINSIPGTIMGGVIIGLLENLAGGYVRPAYKDLVAFVILLLTLLVRPNGLLWEFNSGQGVRRHALSNGHRRCRGAACGSCRCAHLHRPYCDFCRDLHAAGHRPRLSQRLHQPDIARAGRHLRHRRLCDRPAHHEIRLVADSGLSAIRCRCRSRRDGARGAGDAPCGPLFRDGHDRHSPDCLDRPDELDRADKRAAGCTLDPAAEHRLADAGGGAIILLCGFRLRACFVRACSPHCREPVRVETACAVG